jgi:cobalamin biosynthesis Mg chelatase CobN
LATRTKAKPKPQPEPEVEEVEDEVEDEETELDELDEDVEEEAPAKATRSRDDEVTYGAAHLAKDASKVAGKEIKPRDLRTLLRKMARDGRIQRDIVAGNRSRYDWPEGRQHPEVKKVLRAIRDGELEAGKREALQKLKDRKAAEKASGTATKKATKATKATKAKKAAPVVEDIEDDEDFDLDDEE